MRIERYNKGGDGELGDSPWLGWGEGGDYAPLTRHPSGASLSNTHSLGSLQLRILQKMLDYAMKHYTCSIFRHFLYKGPFIKG